MVDPATRVNTHVSQAYAGAIPVGEALSEYLDRGNRLGSRLSKPTKSQLKAGEKPYRARSPTRSERLNRALKELRPAAFKIHALIWAWRGAPAKGNLPYFTIRSLEKFCNLTRPTVRKAFNELVEKGYIVRLPYNVSCKNTLYKLIPVRKIPVFIEKKEEDVEALRTSGCQPGSQAERRG